MEEEVNIDPIDHSDDISKFDDERLVELFKKYPFSPNIRWEMVKRKLISDGKIGTNQLAKDSLYMQDRMAFFQEAEDMAFQNELNLEESREVADHSTIDRADKSEVGFGDNEKSEDLPKDKLEGEKVESKEDPVIKEEEFTGEKAQIQEEQSAMPQHSSNESKEDLVEDRIKSVEQESGDIKEVIRDEGPSDFNIEIKGEDREEVDNILRSHSVKPPPNQFSTVQDGDEEKATSNFTKWLSEMKISSNPDEGSVKEQIEDNPEIENPEELVEEKSVDTKDRPKQKKGKKNPKKKRKHPRELELQPDIASETLADLLASQGHTEQANEMYRQLSMKYPEKSSYFASKIKNS